MTWTPGLPHTNSTWPSSVLPSSPKPAIHSTAPPVPWSASALLPSSLFRLRLNNARPIRDLYSRAAGAEDRSYLGVEAGIAGSVKPAFDFLEFPIRGGGPRIRRKSEYKLPASRLLAGRKESPVSHFLFSLFQPVHRASSFTFPPQTQPDGGAGPVIGRWGEAPAPDKSFVDS